MSDNVELFLKPENLQVTGSLKIRGAYYKISTLTHKEKARGIVACSAGNHAQGVALAARENNTKATIFLPATAPIYKIEATRKFGAEVRLVDGGYDDLYKSAFEFRDTTGAVLVHPFDDDDIIAGQATIGLEIAERNPDMEAVIVPVGGGGLASGIAFAVKSINPNCKVYGAQAAGAASMQNAIREKKRCALPAVSTFADGIAVKTPGEKTFDLCSRYLDGVASVTDDEIALAILMLMERQKLVAEGAGAAGVAAVLCDKIPELRGKKVCAVVSGGNIDVNILSRVIHRGLLKSGRLSDLRIELLDKPGQLESVSRVIARNGANVTRVNHNFSGENSGINDCILEISLETRDHAHLDTIRAELEKAGYKIKM
jgi:threonine dehydratase